MGFDGSAEGAEDILKDKTAERAASHPVSTDTDGEPLRPPPHTDSIPTPTTTPEQVQTPPHDQEQAQISTQAPEKKGPFGFLDFFSRMKGQKTTPPPSGSEPYRRPDGGHGLKVHSDKVPDQIDTADTEPNPEYNPNTAPDNISPIDESVASGGRLPTEPQEESKT